MLPNEKKKQKENILTAFLFEVNLNIFRLNIAIIIVLTFFKQEI